MVASRSGDIMFIFDLTTYSVLGYLVLKMPGKWSALCLALCWITAEGCGAKHLKKEEIMKYLETLNSSCVSLLILVW